MSLAEKGKSLVFSEPPCPHFQSGHEAVSEVKLLEGCWGSGLTEGEAHSVDTCLSSAGHLWTLLKYCVPWEGPECSVELIFGKTDEFRVKGRSRE